VLRGARQQQVGGVGHGDQQHQRGGGHQDEQGRPATVPEAALALPAVLQGQPGLPDIVVAATVDGLACSSTNAPYVPFNAAAACCRVTPLQARQQVHPVMEDLINHPIIFSFLGCHPIISVRIFFNFFTVFPE